MSDAVPGVVYLIVLSNGIVKVGLSGNYVNRLATHRSTAAAHGLDVVHSESVDVSDMAWMETQLLTEFRKRFKATSVEYFRAERGPAVELFREVVNREPRAVASIESPVEKRAAALDEMCRERGLKFRFKKFQSFYPDSGAAMDDAVFLEFEQAADHLSCIRVNTHCRNECGCDRVKHPVAGDGSSKPVWVCPIEECTSRSCGTSKADRRYLGQVHNWGTDDDPKVALEVEKRVSEQMAKLAERRKRFERG
ncbi:GIY-YIG nuclease family protein [Nocardia sp. NPDC058518]|uniref:GIY-YIG nuclease family protein n=1 Tax=Nocardia sp. NPDC058518 TaxID=3346534 RepID=UPI0036475C9E